jgi:hypothetical protein
MGRVGDDTSCTNHYCMYYILYLLLLGLIEKQKKKEKERESGRSGIKIQNSQIIKDIYILGKLVFSFHSVHSQNNSREYFGMMYTLGC